MKARIFIGSSVEGLNVSYAIQENLEHAAEVTVWDQDIFKLSKPSVNSLLDVLHNSDFAIFVFHPDDVSSFRNEKVRTVRDNVIFEFGMFVGYLGIENCFIVLPKGIPDLHIPTDLLGITPATYEPNRSDGNLRAALGPCCNQIKNRISKAPSDSMAREKVIDDSANEMILNEGDILALLHNWWPETNDLSDKIHVEYSSLDKKLNLQPGSTKRYLHTVAKQKGYISSSSGEKFATFEIDAAKIFGSINGY